MLISKSIFARRAATLATFALFAAVMALSVAPAFGQALENMVYTVGTTTQDAAHRNWGYIVWQGTTPGLIQNKHFAIYAKAGDATSANPYTRQAITSVQTDPTAIKVILNRAINLGDDLNQLSTRINNLFEKIMPPGTWTLEEKVSIVIRGSLNDPNYFNNLIMLAHLHPSISICLGMAQATLIDAGFTTFEVREYDLAKNSDIGVVGRVTLQPGAPIVLPATGGPVLVPDTSAKGNLNVLLRWGMPDDLRRLSLLNYGFNVYRMTKAFAEGGNYNVTPPDPNTLVTLTLSNPNLVQLNHMPVLKNRDYTLAEAANIVADPTNSFFADDNRRYEPGGVAFNNGDRFYYFVAARDVLGRIGKVSLGTLITICDRLPPNAPTGVSVANDYNYLGSGVSKQVLKVRWKQDTQQTDTVKAYYIYRWQSPDQVQQLAGNPLSHRIAGPIAHIANQEFNTYVDDGAGSPSMPADAGKTFWYTVRSEDNGACGGNLSPNSGPIFGVLRDRVGPDGPDGWVNIICRRPIVENGKLAPTKATTQQNESFAYYDLICTRRDAGIAWADFYVFDTQAASNYLGRVFFKLGDAAVSVPYIFPRSALANQREMDFFCKVGSFDGLISNVSLFAVTQVPSFGEVLEVNFDAYTSVQQVRAVSTPGRQSPCFRHVPTGPGGTDPGSVTPTTIIIVLTPGTKEFKLYRRVDFGPLTLVKQGPADFDKVSQITIDDDAMPPNAGTICYYGQLFDEHGNASPLTLLGGDCILVSGTTPLPTPMLAKLETSGTEASPTMTIKWFCPPYGVDRFLVHISVDLGSLPASISDQMSDYLSSTPDPEVYTLKGNPHTNDFYTYKTPRIGPGFGQGAQFEIDAHVIQGKTYTVFITALGKDSSEGPKSNVEQGTWSPAIVTGPKVPWPARPLPAFNLFNAQLLADQLPPSIYDGTGVRIGLVTDRMAQQTERGPQIIFSGKDPMTYMGTNNAGEKLFPVAMYRVQVVNTAFPKVSGDVVQVSPLMEEIAYDLQTVNGVSQVTIRDPFIRIGPAPPASTFVGYPMYLVDTQPVIAGAKYIYLLVRFDDNHEIKEIVPSSFVEVTP